ncbi:hypothetical protein DIE15_33860 [Burkholderia sp. Bp9031]|nr:hypothetical protein DIE15_33860 [Burkholderia sp. Bp9031]
MGRRASLVWLGQTALRAPCTASGNARSQVRHWPEQALPRRGRAADLSLVHPDEVARAALA